MGRTALCRSVLGRRPASDLRIAVVAAMMAVLSPAPAAAQVGDDIPRTPYYLAVQTFYSGDYIDAERGLRRETRRGVRTVQERWIDSICYHAMLGEVLYHQGRNAEALAEFDQACQILLAYPNWLLQVKFIQPPRPDIARTRRIPPWGRSERQFTLGQFAETEQVFMGELDPRRALQEGGVFRSFSRYLDVTANVTAANRTAAIVVDHHIPGAIIARSASPLRRRVTSPS